MAKTKQSYDEKSRTMWVAKPDADGDYLVPSDEVQTWTKALQAQKTPEGKPLERVNYVFADADAAEYNHHALSFANIGTYVGDLKEHEPFGDGDEPSFDTKKDFGM